MPGGKVDNLSEGPRFLLFSAFSSRWKLCGFLWKKVDTLSPSLFSLFYHWNTPYFRILLAKNQGCYLQTYRSARGNAGVSHQIPSGGCRQLKKYDSSFDEYLKEPAKSLPLEGARSARKMIQWIIFSIGRAAAPDGGLRGTNFIGRIKQLRAGRMR